MASRSFSPILNIGSKRLSRLTVSPTCPKPQMERVPGFSCTTIMRKLDQFSHDQEKYSLDHTFNHPVSVAGIEQIGEIQQFMLSTHPGTNPRWIDVALRNGDRCVTVQL